MLGNYVVCRVGGKDSDKRSIPMKVVALFDDCAYLDFDGNEGDVWEEKEDGLFGIEITAELMEKIGFEKLCSFGGVTKYDIDGARVELAADVSIEYYLKSVNGIRYLHQLQNAYHLLTGKDLEVKL